VERLSKRSKEWYLFAAVGACGYLAVHTGAPLAVVDLLIYQDLRREKKTAQGSGGFSLTEAK
jgi:hypothetical protein